MEVWKNIVGFENYKVSNLGNVIGLEIKTDFGRATKIYPERVINAWIDKKGYHYIDICKKGKYKRYLLHRLVAMHFIENTHKKPQVNHIDGIKSNNKVENLEWCTAKENLKHARDTGLNDNSGEKNYQSKLSESDVLYIRNSKETQKQLCEKFNISQSGISSVLRFKTYKNVGK